MDEFLREHGCTEAEWLGWLPRAVHGHAWTRPHAQAAVVDLGEGTLALDWQVLPPRRIALLNLPRLAVRYRFEGVPAGLRDRFLKRFDLHLQRGGG